MAIGDGANGGVAATDEPADETALLSDCCSERRSDAPTESPVDVVVDVDVDVVVVGGAGSAKKVDSFGSTRNGDVMIVVTVCGCSSATRAVSSASAVSIVCSTWSTRRRIGMQWKFRTPHGTIFKIVQ